MNLWRKKKEIVQCNAMIKNINCNLILRILLQAAPSVFITNLWNIKRQMFRVQSVESINRGARQHSLQLPGGSWRSSAQIFQLSPKLTISEKKKLFPNSSEHFLWSCITTIYEIFDMKPSEPASQIVGTRLRQLYMLTINKDDLTQIPSQPKNEDNLT